MAKTDASSRMRVSTQARRCSKLQPECASCPHRKARRTQRLTTLVPGGVGQRHQGRARAGLSCGRMCSQPIFQGIVHARLPALAGSLERRDDLRVEAHRQGLLGALQLHAARRKCLTQRGCACLWRYRLLTDFPLALLEEVVRQLWSVVGVNPGLGRILRSHLFFLKAIDTAGLPAVSDGDAHLAPEPGATLACTPPLHSDIQCIQ